MLKKPITERSSMNFSDALTELKNGKGLTRAAWNGRAIVKLQKPDKGSKMTAPYLYIDGDSIQPFTPGQDSILSDDWQVVEGDK